MSERAAITVAFVLAALGVLLLVPFDAVITLVAGTLCLLGFIAFGAYALLRPDRLGD